jgi:uncharacterized protein (TIGR02145 family)
MIVINHWLKAALFLSLALFLTTSVCAQDKVVVIPLFSEPTAANTCTAPDEVLSQGRCWKDRNLGAASVATASDDAAAYGDLYQWGRLGDGHQYINRTVFPNVPISGTTTEISVNDVPRHSNFIVASSSPWDWRVPQNDSLWQGLGGVNNPCPQGFRLPTATELETEILSWSSQNAAGAFASPLKLVMAGWRPNVTTGILYNVGNYGFYWSSTVSGIRAYNMVFASGHAEIVDNSRVIGQSVRCIKD